MKFFYITFTSGDGLDRNDDAEKLKFREDTGTPECLAQTHDRRKGVGKSLKSFAQDFDTSWEEDDLMANELQELEGDSDVWKSESEEGYSSGVPDTVEGENEVSLSDCLIWNEEVRGEESEPQVLPFASPSGFDKCSSYYIATNSTGEEQVAPVVMASIEITERRGEGENVQTRESVSVSKITEGKRVENQGTRGSELTESEAHNRKEVRDDWITDDGGMEGATVEETDELDDLEPFLESMGLKTVEVKDRGSGWSKQSRQRKVRRNGR